ncbi:MAG: phosphoenolpyruvate--protein phosphotransferase [Desulfomonilaceae bacterium]|nr:phosphoenolpyruvate--protein phosphotransferase [Desulfomonilaceae bacterium]
MKTTRKIEDNQATEAPKNEGNQTNLLIRGIAVSGGVGIGQAVVIERITTDISPRRIIKPEEVSSEIERFTNAVGEAADRLKGIKRGINVDHPLSEHRYIFDTQIMLLHDRMFFDATKKAIAAELQNAEWAISDVITKITAAFDTIEDEYLRERARDIYFVGERVLKILMGVRSETKIHQLPPNSIIVSHDLSPADTVQMAKESVIGFAVDMGGKTSHTAIMARSLKIPAVTGLDRMSSLVQTGDTVIVDGSTGVVIVNPDPDTIFRFRERQEVYRKYHQSLLAFGKLPAVTSDGVRTMRITANIELLDEVEIAISHGSEGIGLFRTEYLFLGRRTAPDEEEQYEAYRHVLARHDPNPVTIRTLDVGGDKISYNLNLAHETNPALGLRAIRLCLSRRDLFKTQLRAILRAAVHGYCRLLLPMISCISEIHLAKEVLEEVKDELAAEGKEFRRDVKLGILVEVPSAVTIADMLAREVDFFSIGTNDLIQYALAIDRVNEHVNYLYDTLHPAVLRLIQQVTNVGQAGGVCVSMCGEMAGDPINIPILLGLGLDELSMNALSIPMVKKLIRSVRMDECLDLTHQVFKMQGAQEIRALMEEWIRTRFPRDYFVGHS